MRKETERIVSFHRLGKLLMTIVAMLCLMPYGSAQGTKHAPKFARPMHLKDSTLLVAVDNGKVLFENVRTIPGAKLYLLVNGTYMPTVREDNGDVLFENDTIPLDNEKYPKETFNISSWSLRKPVTEHMPLEARLVRKYEFFRYADNIFEKEEFKNYKDSLVHRKTIVHTYLTVDNGENEKGISFQLVVNDTALVTDARFITGNPIELDDNLIEKLGLPKPDTTIKETHPAGVLRIQVIPKNRVPSYINALRNEVGFTVDATAVPPKDGPDGPDWKKWLAEHRWSWIVLGVLVLALIAWLTKRFWRPLFGKKGQKNPNPFVFKLGSIDVQDHQKSLKCLEQLDNKYKQLEQLDKEKAESLCFAIPSDTEVIISFEVNEQNADLFDPKPVDPTIPDEELSFYQTLKKYIKDIEKEGNLPKQKKDLLKEAIDRLHDVEDYAASLLGAQSSDDKKSAPQEATGEPPQTGDNSQEAIEDLKRTIKEKEKELAAKQRQIETLTSDKTRLNKKIKDLEDDIRLWQTDTGYTSSSNAKQKIEQLQASKKELDDVKRDPALFKNKPGYGKLTEIIENAEKGETIRQELNENPEKLDPKLKSGQLVKKGEFFEKCLTDPDYIFDTEYKDKALAQQVHKGDFFDKAKDHVKEIAECKEPWLVGTELQNFIYYVVNPETILTSKQVKTGLYKLVDDIENLISKKAKAGQPINPNELSSGWLNHQFKETLTGYDSLLDVIEVAKDFGRKKMEANRLPADLQPVFAAADACLDFQNYKNYWKNIVNPVFVALEDLPKHDEVHNTRALMFYTSQFYSIACIMNDIYGNRIYDVSRPKLNTEVFNGNVAPVPTHYGFPEIDQSALDKCKFQYKGAAGEDDKVKFLKKYKPLHFILISSYFDDNRLS